MAGRGGRSTSSFTKDQLQAMGAVGNTAPLPSTICPPPLFPIIGKPTPLDNSLERQYKIMWKEDYVSFLKDSPYFLVSKPKKKDNNTEEQQNVEIKAKSKAEFLWHLMPPELKPNFKRQKSDAKGTPNLNTKRKKVENIEERLKALEEKEKTPNVKIKTEKNDDSEDEEDKEDQEEEPEQDDDEMDFENDYGNNYFDNGEAFNEEDDNLDDGPVY